MRIFTFMRPLYSVESVKNEASVKTALRHFGHMPNMSLLYVAATLENLNVEVLYIDPVGMELSPSDVDAKLQQFDPDIVGLSSFTNKIHTTHLYAQHIMALLPDTKIMVGGAHTWDFPTDTLKYHPAFDYACVGEAEIVLPEFVERWNGNESFDGMNGLVRRDGDQIQFAGRPDVNMDLDSRPFPARHLTPNEKYYNFISTRRNYTIFNTSQGCPFQCIFCNVSGTKYRMRSAANVVAEFEECYENFGVREVDIFDSSFTVSKKRVMEICRLLVKNGLGKKMIWDVRSRVDTIDEEMLDALKEAGCYRIFYGIESADQKILKKLRKEIKIDRIEQIVRKTDQLGISVFGYFLVGSPGETPETFRTTVEFAKRLPIDFAMFSVLTAHPKTELYEKYYLPAVQHDFWEDYLANSDLEGKFMGRPWTDISDAELERLAHRATNEFYFRPKQIYRAIRTVKSMDQMKRYIAAGWDMLWNYLVRY
ncbi:hypothetical protein D1AOALGA4SA_1304 [Olavius algarvensis Delta 1 endosymbiont]|nr:hypothetical protein D1AOALGA4SA_1304 [Olavius algarvensis Delta 1 endosymbiont]